MVENNVSAKKLAAVLDVSGDTVYRVLRGQPISKDMAWKLHVLTGQKLMELLYEDVDQLIADSIDLLRYRGRL